VRTRVGSLLLVVALLAGCGGGRGDGGRLSKAQFEQRIKADGAAVEKAVAKIQLGSGSLGKQIGAAERAVKAAADDLAAAKPPADAEPDVKAIVRGLRTIDAQLMKLERAAKNGDALAAQAAAKAIQGAPAVRAAQKAAADLKKKGYDIGAIGR
jgi:hypothetical protein